MNKYLFAILGCVVALTTACDDRDDEITSIDYARPFSPSGLEARVQNNVNVRLMWTSMAEGATYTIEVYEEDEVSYSFTGTPVFKIEGVEGNEYTVEDLNGDTTFSAYVQAVVDGKKSNYKGVSFTTGGEQSLTDVVVEGNTITVYWKDGSNPTNVVIRLNDEAILDHKLTAEDLANGYYVVEGLEYETKYTVRLKRDDTNIGEKTGVETGVDASQGDVIKEGDDLVTILDEIEDGETVLLDAGTFEIGDYTWTKDITIKAAGSEKPVIKCLLRVSAGASIKIQGCSLVGGNSEGTEYGGDQCIIFNEGGEYGDVYIKDCEISDYKKGVYYLNSGNPVVENITFDNCIFHDITASDGDMFDCRTGYVGELSITNSTIYNCAPSRDFIRYDDASANFADYPAPVVIVDHCTIDNVIQDKADKRLLYVRFAGTQVTWTNNIVSNCNPKRGYNDQNPSNYGYNITFKDNWYYNVHNLVEFETDYTTSQFYDEEGNVLTTSPYTDPSSGDFTIVESDETYYIINDGIGDPRWIK